MSYIKGKDGFTLLEVLIAIALLSVGLLSIAGMMVVSIRGNASGGKLSVATTLAQDKIEELRNVPFDNIYMNCDDPALWNGGNMALCTDAPANMTDDNNTVTVVDDITVTPADDGSNTCSQTAPCGDLQTGDGIWTYDLGTTMNGNTYNRIWTVQRNFPEYKMITAEAIASYTDQTGPHRVRIKTIFTK